MVHGRSGAPGWVSLGEGPERSRPKRRRKLRRVSAIRCERMHGALAQGKKAGISPTRAEDFPQWFQSVVRDAEVAELDHVRGCMVIRPWGYGIWELMRDALDEAIKASGSVNAYFPLFIPLSYFEEEAKHVEGFAKEMAVVTHHRLEQDPDGSLRPAAEL